MISADFETWRKTLSSPELRSLVDYVTSLDKKTTAERALKTRDKFKNIPPDLLRVALETVAGRETLESEPWSKEGFFLQSRLEQATNREIAKHHAESFRDLHVLEIACGIGFDSAALAKKATQVTAIDIDPLVCAIAEHNLALQGIRNVSVVCTSLESFQQEASLESFDAIWADPGRRTDNGERVYDPDEYRPPLRSLTDLPFSKRVGIKISPALNVGELSPEWSREFIGWEWGCPEQILWRGADKAAAVATLVDHGESWRRRSDQAAVEESALLAPGKTLIEPHPALVRTSELEYFYGERGIAQIDSGGAFGACETAPSQSPWYRAFEIVETFRYSPKALKERLSKLKWDSRTQIKKRGLDENPDQIHRALKLPTPDKGSPWGYVILCKIGHAPTAILATRREEQ